MLTYRTGAAGSMSAAMAMAEYMFEEDVPELQQVMAKYYAAGTAEASDLAGSTIAMPRRDMNPDLAEKLGIDPNRNMRVGEVANLMAGLRADGEPIAGRANWKSTENKTRLSYIDLTFSAPKSLSVAIVFAETAAERAVLDSAHTTAVDRTLAVIMQEIGVASKGKAACEGYEAGEMAYVKFEHFTARPVAKVARTENGVAETELVTVRGIVGDPQRHTHAIVPLVVLTPTGRVGSPPLDRMKDRVHEWGSLYQAFLATELRASGVDARLDPKTGAAYLPAIPKWVSDMFSKRHFESDKLAREFASTRGLDWDTLSADSRISLLRTSSMSSRNSKADGMPDFVTWLAEAHERGYVHKRALHPETARSVPAEDVQITTAWAAARPMLSEEFYRRATLEGHLVRTMAARGLIESGINSAADIDRVTAAFRERGVDHNGHRVPLLWAKEEGQRFATVTTGLHVDQEREVIDLLQAAAADRSSNLSPKAIQAAVDRFLTANPHISLDTEHGKSQRAMIDRLGRSGRAGMGVGSAGSGKTTLLTPLADAWQRAGRQVYGVTLAWRQTMALAEAGIGRQTRPVRRGRLAPDTDQLERSGISSEHTMAMARFLKQAGEGKLTLNRNSVVVLDEAATIGTRQLLLLTRLQAEYGFQLVALGDDRQVQAIEHGNSVKLFRKALGAEQVPEIATTVRQDSERDRATAGLFREGRADEALARKIQDGTVMLVPGNADHAIRAAVDLWEQRQRENADNPRYRIGISVPTNDAVRAVGEEVRRRRRASGEVGPDVTTMPAQDQLGGTYALPLAKGDRVRLFARAYAVGGGMFGENGTVAQIESMDATGVTMRRMDNGRSATVLWETLRDPDTQRIRLTYGDALTVDTRQGDTLTEHILLMPAGSQAVNGFKGYSGESRHRARSWIVTSQGAEMQEVVGRRALGDPRPVTDEDLIGNMGRNLSRQPEKVLASDFLERAETLRRGAVRNMQAADYGRERREADGQPATNVGERRAEHDEQAAAAAVAVAIQRLAAPLKRIAYEDHEASRARRAMKRPAERPKVGPAPRREPTMRTPISEVDAMSEFADALTRAGIRLRGAPIMDGKMHRVQVDGDRGTKKSGSYVGYLDGTPAGYIHNYKTGEEVRWKASSTTAPLSDAERARLTAQMEASRQARDAQRRANEETTARDAERIWARAQPVVSHPYLTRKNVRAHGIRQDNRGRLLVPMRDAAGRLWNLQTINTEGTKLFMKGRKRGTFAVLGDMAPGAPIAVAEGYATAATIREVTGLTTVAAFDSGNLMEVAQALRKADLGRPIVFAADNDHHAPRREPPLPNVGMNKATAASTAVGGVLLLPKFEPSDPGTDWNDVASSMGRRAVREMLRAELGSHGIDLPPAAARATAVSQAARDAARERMQAPSNTDVAARAAAEAARAAQRARGPTA